MFRGKVRYDKSCNRWYVDLHHKGRRDKTYKYLGVMPCPGRHKRRSPMHLAEYARVWNKACKDAGVLRVPLYQATRHSFVCQMLNSGIDKSMVQRLLRHTDPKITDRYAEYSTNALRVKLDNVFRINRQETVRKAKRAETSG